MFNNKYPEDQTQNRFSTVAPSANPGNAMAPPNYKISGPLANHQPDTKLRDAAIDVGGGIAGKGIEGTLFGGGPKGTFFEKGLWGLGGGAGAGGAGSAAATGGMLGGASPLASGLAGGTAGAGASAAGAGLSAGLAAAAPIAIPALIGAKMFGLFNKGGSVGPLAPQYKQSGGPTLEDYDNDPLLIEWQGLYDDYNSGIIEADHPRVLELQAILDQKYGANYYDRGGYQEDEMSHRSKNMRVPYPNFMDFARMTGRNIWSSDEVPMWEKIMMTGAIPVDYGMSKLKHAIHNKDYGLTRNAINYDDPMVLNPGEVHQSMILGPLSDINYRNQGGEATSKPQSTKIEKKETIEYKS